MKKQKEKNNEIGITLIALVITIIVLLILAGVSIAMLTGNNGILTQAQNAKNKTTEAAKDEQLDLARQEDLINETLNGIEVEQVTDSNPGVLEKNGTEYTINSIEDLVVFAYDVTGGKKYSGETVKLGLSLDFNSTKSYVDPFRTDYEEYGYNGELKTLLTTDEGFKPIGTTYDANVSTNFFEGTFDGNYNAIYNLYQNFENSDYTSIIGLFTTNAGVISNLKVENATINCTTNNMHIITGVLVGRNRGTVKNCSVSGNLEVIDNGVKRAYCGGIIGQAMGKEVEKSYSKTNITLKSSNSSRADIGGIAGALLSENTVKSCYNLGTINGYFNSDVEKNIGGIIGASGNNVDKCYNLGTINLYNTINEITKSNYIGNLVGSYSQGKISNSYNLGIINMELENPSDSICIGNVTGYCYQADIENCHNVGKINIKNIEQQNIGQIAGKIHTTNVNNCIGLIENDINLIGNEYQSTVNNTELVEKNEIPDILEIIGEDFKEDTNNINEGNPILNWQ